MSYYPYGQERPQSNGQTTPNGTDKFATYFRDAVGQDYADQRYYNQAGRFFSPDPGGIATADSSNPGSWNRYSYASGDPVNRHDPHGTEDCDPTDPDDPCYDPCWPVEDLARRLRPEFLENPGCGGEPAPFPPPRPAPPPLECHLTGFASQDAAYWVNPYTGHTAIAVPTYFTFSASGGDGTYAWSNTQTFEDSSGSATYTSPPPGASSFPAPFPGAPGASDGSLPRMQSYTGPTPLNEYSIGDAPGYNTYAGIGFSLQSGSASATFMLDVTVTSGGQTATCGALWAFTLTIASPTSYSGNAVLLATFSQ
jgi:RHS repeat-associated protein